MHVDQAGQEQGAAAGSPRIFERPERAVGMPVREGAELLGYLYARVPEDASSEAWLAKTQSFVSELPVAFRRVKLFQEVERLSEIDGLTGVRIGAHAAWAISSRRILMDCTAWVRSSSVAM